MKIILFLVALILSANVFANQNQSIDYLDQKYAELTDKILSKELSLKDKLDFIKKFDEAFVTYVVKLDVPKSNPEMKEAYNYAQDIYHQIIPLTQLKLNKNNDKILDSSSYNYAITIIIDDSPASIKTLALIKSLK